MIKDFIENQKIKAPFLVAGINKGINTNTGKPYYSISLQLYFTTIWLLCQEIYLIFMITWLRHGSGSSSTDI